MFIIAAIWNIAGAIAGWITTANGTSGGMSLTPQDALFIIAFGVGFLFIAYNITKNQGIAVLGIIEKVSTFVLVYGAVPIVIGSAAISAVDMVFVVLFIEYLVWSKKNAS
jgi:hypothetical protein